ncbi:MAG TPA: flagellar biosynthesis anti-sigma factor FlgM [Tepidisphaeraceae bacterium]|nr:flagellar biosynthesis anti-sigma factor FlgM [Tepidisphaeraceae bacterium]
MASYSKLIDEAGPSRIGDLSVDSTVVSQIEDGDGDGVASQLMMPAKASKFQPGFVMSSINGIGPNSPVQKIVEQPIQKQTPVDPPKQLPVVDKLELSGVSHLLKSLKNNDVRVDKVAEIKSQIEAGNYETDDKLDVAADRLLDDLTK